MYAESVTIKHANQNNISNESEWTERANPIILSQTNSNTEDGSQAAYKIYSIAASQDLAFNYATAGNSETQKDQRQPAVDDDNLEEDDGVSEQASEEGRLQEEQFQQEIENSKQMAAEFEKDFQKHRYAPKTS